MLLIELVYVSRASIDFCDDELVNLLKVARAFNNKNGITGLLLFDGKSTFIQVLEGSRVTVNSLFSTIENDRRHENVEVLSKRLVFRRSFDQWAMDFKRIEEQDNRSLERLNGYINYLNSAQSELDNKKGVGIELLQHFKEKTNCA
ncbi:BLUF domain-containing protein [Agaribacter flavus]|uniref:BLUF domain-containing protein n=1 Tax=Agaribacter flavus TaxID=1902781 RepID=A0ABV7FRC6_9ALTE